MASMYAFTRYIHAMSKTNYVVLFVATLLIITPGCGSGSSATDENTAGAESQPRWSLALHGGAGHFDSEDLSAAQEAQYRASLSTALEMGIEVLESGGAAVDAVEQVIRILEDDSLFNAGRGAVYTADGGHELDASIMDGDARNCGAVTGIQGIRHPISAARAVMDRSEHVFFSGHGAGLFALEQGLESAPPEWFDTEKAYKRYQKALATWEDQKMGTVGCVALDLQGRLCAGTSTGGMTFKQHGRIGDSPVVGAGTWADRRTCAVSATGWGEYFIRTAVAHDIHGAMLHGGLSLEDAARHAIHEEMGALGGTGGVICVGNDGTIVFEMNTPGMFRAAANEAGRKSILLFADEGQ
jgi:L-asparaginase / beta-aspartyl-peptidase